ncbi:MAG: DUF5684 domain-containing protein [Lachnospiraceae bacterium]|nr:DUF5684 domain-containing protein [Lachnospiraceae bacterium]
MVNIISILSILGYFFLFEENKVAGWKVVIPFYGEYLQYKLFYKKNLYWLRLILELIFLAGVFVLALLGAIVKTGTGYQITDAQGITFLAMLILCIIAFIGIVIMDICYKVSLSKKYDKGGLFLLALIFFEPFAIAYLAWERRDELNK